MRRLGLGVAAISMIVALGRTAAIPANWAVCAQNVCKNGGTCYHDGGAEFCTCAPNFGGELCERRLEPNTDSEESKIASLMLACWILALLLCLTCLVAALGWLCFRKKKHELEDLADEHRRLALELKRIASPSGESKLAEAGEQQTLLDSTLRSSSK